MWYQTLYHLHKLFKNHAGLNVVYCSKLTRFDIDELINLRLVYWNDKINVVDILRSVLHKIEYFNFRWTKIVSSCQDGAGAADTRWKLVVMTKTCVWVGIPGSVVGYVQVKACSKCWSITRIGANCVRRSLTFQRSFKWRKIFFISQWKYERSWSLFVAITCYNVKILF